MSQLSPVFQIDTPFGRVDAVLTSGNTATLRSGTETDDHGGVLINRVTYCLQARLRRGAAGWWHESYRDALSRGERAPGPSDAAVKAVERVLVPAFVQWAEEHPEALVEGQRASLLRNRAIIAERARYQAQRLAEAQGELAEIDALLEGLPQPVIAAPDLEADDTF